MGLLSRIHLQHSQASWLCSLCRGSSSRLSLPSSILHSGTSIHRCCLATWRYRLLSSSTRRILQSEPQSFRSRLHNFHQERHCDLCNSSRISCPHDPYNRPLRVSSLANSLPTRCHSRESQSHRKHCKTRRHHHACCLFPLLQQLFLGSPARRQSSVALLLNIHLLTV